MGELATRRSIFPEILFLVLRNFSFHLCFYFYCVQKCTLMKTINFSQTETQLRTLILGKFCLAVVNVQQKTNNLSVVTKYKII